MSDEHDNIVFALSSSRTDGEFMDELMDELDMFDEDNWDIVAWVRGKTTRIVLYAPYFFRLIVDSEHLELKIHPVGQVMTGMEDSRNQWLVPVKKGHPSDQLALETVGRWSREMYCTDDLGTKFTRQIGESASSPEQEEESPRTRSSRRKIGATPSRAQLPVETDKSIEEAPSQGESMETEEEAPPKPTEDFEKTDVKDKIKEIFGLNEIKGEDGGKIELYSMSSPSDSQ